MGRSNKKRKKIVTISISMLLIIVGLFLVMNPPFVDHFIYPIGYQNHIFTYANNVGMDPYLVMAIIRVETKFKPNEESRAGAKGLMQLMPETVNLAVRRGVPPVEVNNIKEPSVNIQIGSWYLSVLYKEFKGNEVAAIASYNAGPGNVRRWIRNGTWDGTKKQVEKVPFKETREYIKRVYYFYGKYRDLHLG